MSATSSALRIAAVLGDDYHDPAAQTAVLRETAREIGASIDTFLDPLGVPWESLSQWSMIIMAREGRKLPKTSKDVWFTPAHEHQLSAYVHAGGSLAALHAGIASYGHTGEYGRLIHGSFEHHPVEHPEFQLLRSRISHEITEGVEEFSIRDEMYFVRVDSKETSVLMKTYAADYGSSAALWAHQAGQGRVFCFTPGHREEVFSSPGYRSVLARGLRWLAGAG